MSNRNLKFTDKDLRDWIFASELCGNDRHTLLTLAHAINRSDLTMAVDYPTIAGWLDLSVRQSKNRVKSLERLSILKLSRSGGGFSPNGCGYPNIWAFDFDALKAISTFDPSPKEPSPDSNTAVNQKTDSSQNRRVQSSSKKGDAEQQEECNPAAGRVKQVAHNPRIPIDPMTTKEDANLVKSNSECLAGFESWWETYPSRPRCPRGNKSEAFESWRTLTIEQRAEVVIATNNLVESGRYPKDAQRFLRPESGSKNGQAVYKTWINIPPSTLYPKGTESAKHHEDDSWLEEVMQ